MFPPCCMEEQCCKHCIITLPIPVTPSVCFFFDHFEIGPRRTSIFVLQGEDADTCVTRTSLCQTCSVSRALEPSLPQKWDCAVLFLSARVACFFFSPGLPKAGAFLCGIRGTVLVPSVAPGWQL